MSGRGPGVAARLPAAGRARDSLPRTPGPPVRLRLRGRAAPPEWPLAEYRYEIDARDRITWVDPAWLRFARENAAGELTAEHVVGRPVLDFVSGGPVRQLYSMLFQAVRGARAVRVPFRCDAPDRRRFMELCIEPADGGGLRLSGRLLREELRAPVALLEPERPHGAALVAICSWCKRIRTAPGRWEEVEDAVRRLGLFDEAALPGLTHGICGRCDADMGRVLDAAERRDAEEPDPPPVS